MCVSDNFDISSYFAKTGTIWHKQWASVLQYINDARTITWNIAVIGNVAPSLGSAHAYIQGVFRRC
jgi:hypothetical protein